MDARSCYADSAAPLRPGQGLAKTTTGLRHTLTAVAVSATSDEPADLLRPRIQRVLDHFLDAQRTVLIGASPQTEPLVDAAAQLLSGGKRLRPIFCYWGWRAAGGQGDDEAVVAAAAALELFQAAALVHDDVIDSSDTRRGQPSIHRLFAARHRDSGWHGDPEAFGVAAAILLGDLLLGWSDELLSSAGLEAAELARARPVFELMRTEVGGGQYLDVLEQVRTVDSRADAVARARNVIRYKSARYSVEHPLVMGGCFADAPEDVRAGFGAYGRSLGEAFQLRDDILGVFGDPVTTGKPAGDDLREGKRTVLVALALERADQRQRALISAKLGNPDLDLDGVEALRQVLIDTKALARTEALVAELVDDARSALSGVKVTAEGGRALAQLIELATVRTH